MAHAYPLPQITFHWPLYIYKAKKHSNNKTTINDILNYEMVLIILDLEAVLIILNIDVVLTTKISLTAISLTI